MPIEVPPLRQRTEDIPLLARHFLGRCADELDTGARFLADATIDRLVTHPWRGNVRELENMVKRMVVLGNERTVLTEINQSQRPQPIEEAADELDMATFGADFANGQELDLKAISKRASQIAEKKVIERVLGMTRWNRKEAAERLQISYKALLYKMKENGLSEGR